MDKLSASWERLKLAIGGTVAGGVNRAIAAVGSESENAPEKVLERLEQGIERVRTQMRSQRNPSFLEADQLRLQDMLATAQQLRATIEGARSGGDDARLTGGVGAAPNIGALERARKQREKNEEDARKAAERASREAVKRAEEQARELERLSAASTAATLKSVAALASEAEALEKVNRQLAENNAEIGLSRFEVDELQASRIDDAVAVREQELAMARLAEASEGEIALMQRQIEALREQASLRRAGSQATQAEQTRSEVTESSRRALEEQKRTAEEVGSILSRSISNAMDDGTGFFRQFADDFGRYLRDKMIQALSDQLGNSCWRSSPAVATAAGTATAWATSSSRSSVFTRAASWAARRRSVVRCRRVHCAARRATTAAASLVTSAWRFCARVKVCSRRSRCRDYRLLAAASP